MPDAGSRPVDGSAVSRLPTVAADNLELPEADDFTRRMESARRRVSRLFIPPPLLVLFLLCYLKRLPISVDFFFLVVVTRR